MMVRRVEGLDYFWWVWVGICFKSNRELWDGVEL